MIRSVELDAVPRRVKQLLEDSIVPSPHSVELKRTPLSDYLHRQVRERPHVAELYHENSKLHPYTTMQPVGNGETLEQIRTWFFDTAYDLREDEFLKHESSQLRIRIDDGPPSLKALLAPFSAEGSTTDLLYAADLLMLHDGLLTRLVPQSPFLWTEREVPTKQQQYLGEKLAPNAEAWAQTDAVFFIVACPWRYMLLYGPRGYRHTLLDIGRLLAYFERAADAHEVGLNVLQNFHDTAVDRFVFADGVERSTYAVLKLRL